MAAGLAILLLLPGQRVAMAQDAGPPASEILLRIAALEAQLADLKAQVQHQAGPAAPQATPPVTPSPDQGHDITFGVGLDTYYMYNPARPLGRVNLLRAYDITSNSFSLSQASLILESPVDLKAGRRFGGRVDLQYGQATETLQGNPANEPRPWVYRNIFQAYGTFVAPVGPGLTVDFGKWASSLGFEGNYAKDQINYSRSLSFNFLPFYHMGARVTYQANDAVALHYWITNGTQQTEAFNNFKDQSFGLVLKPTSNVAWTTRSYLGQEHPDVQVVATPGAPALPTQPGLSIVPVDPYFAGKLHIFDTYASWQATPKTLVAVEGDYVVSRNQAPAADSRVSGAALFFRQQLTTAGAIGARAEYLDDDGGLFTGASRKIWETTLTYDHRVADGFLVRSEWRRDVSSTPLFLTSEPGVLDKAQHTLGLGLVWWWGTKRDAW